MHRHLPNALTLMRLVLAALFFGVLSGFHYPHGPVWSPPVCIVVSVMAALTDWLDGYLARRWHVETTFGRIMDPFCDKVLVIGAFIYLAGPRFADQTSETMVSGVYPWMVIVMIARELLVTSIRGELEQTGVEFGAMTWGKIKTMLQLVCIPVVIGIIGFDPHTDAYRWMAPIRDAIVYVTVGVTVFSGLPYITSAVRR